MFQAIGAIIVFICCIPAFICGALFMVIDNIKQKTCTHDYILDSDTFKYVCDKCGKQREK